MKKLIIYLLFVCLSKQTFAQDFTLSNSTQFTFSTGQAPVILTHFESVPKNHVKDALKDVFNNYNATLTSLKDAKDEYMVSEFTLESNQMLSQAKIKLQEINDNISMYINFRNSESIISEEKTPNEINYYKDLVEVIAKKATSITYENLINQQLADIKDQQKKLKSLRNDEDKQHKNIGKYDRENNLSKDKIDGFKENLNSQEILIRKNNDLLKNKENEIASKNVKSMNSSIKELEKSIISLKKMIDKNQKEIAELNGQIAINKSALKGNETEVNTLKNSMNVDKEGRKKLKKLNKENLKYIGIIETYKVSIIDEENKIKDIETQILSHQSEITNIKNNILDHNEDALYEQLKLIEKESKNLKDTKKDLEKNIEKEHKSIEQKTEDIRLSKKEIERLKNEQMSVKETISTLELKIKETEIQKKKFD